MNELLTFAQTISPLGVITLLIIVILQLLRNSGIIDRLRGTQMSDASGVRTKQTTDAIDLAVINMKLDKISDNHLHPIPMIEESLKRMEIEQISQGNRIVKLETKIDMLVKQ